MSMAARKAKSQVAVFKEEPAYRLSAPESLSAFRVFDNDAGWAWPPV